MTKMKTERTIIRSVFLMSNQNAMKSATFHSGKVLRFPRARLQLTWQRKALCQVDLQLALLPQESMYLASVGWRFLLLVCFLFCLIPLRIEANGDKEYFFILIMLFSHFHRIKESPGLFWSSSLFRYLSANRRIQFCSSCLGKVEIRPRKHSEGKIRILLREQHELKIPQESGRCFLRKLKPCPWNA